MTVLLIVSGIALVLGISLMVRRGDGVGLAFLRGTHPGKPIGGNLRSATAAEQLAVVGRTPLRSDRRMLTPSRRRH